MAPPFLTMIHLANHRLHLRRRVVGHGFVSAYYIKMPTVAPDGKITPDPVEAPKDASPPPTELKGGPIEAAAAKTEAAAIEATAARQVLANEGGMTGGGEVEVKIPGGMKMPSAGSGPSFAGNYLEAVKTLDTLQTQGAADTLATAPSQQLDPATQAGGGALPFEPEEPVYSGGGGLRAPHARFHAAELAKGVKMEMEHTDDPRIALEIAKDHLMELPDYYTRLQAMLKRAHANHKKKLHKTKRNGRGYKRTHRRS